MHSLLWQFSIHIQYIAHENPSFPYNAVICLTVECFKPHKLGIHVKVDSLTLLMNC